MALVANDPKAAKRLGIPSKVGKEFMKADKGRKFGDGNVKKYAMGGRMMRPERERLSERIKTNRMPGLKPIPEEPMYKKGGKIADKAGRAMKKRSADTMGRAMVKKYSEGGSVFRKAADGVATKGKTKGKMVKMNKGGYCG